MKFLLSGVCGIFVMTISARGENHPKLLSDAHNALKNSVDPLTDALTHHLEALMRKNTQNINALVAQNFNEAQILKVVLASIQSSIQPSVPASHAPTEKAVSEKKETPVTLPDSMQQKEEVSPEKPVFSTDGKKLTPIHRALPPTDGKKLTPTPSKEKNLLDMDAQELDALSSKVKQG